MIPKVLSDLGFYGIISEATAQTQTGQEVLTKYQTYLMSNPESCEVINQFVREANQCLYDNGVVEALTKVSSYINQNKTGWAIASTCEAINRDDSKRNMLNRNAAAQAAKLLEQDEENIVKYIRSGALKNIMFCEHFRNIAKSVYSSNPIIEHTAEYTKVTPVSMLENVAGDTYFVVAGRLYKRNEEGLISEGNWNEVSNTFKTVESLLESNICKVDENSITIDYNKAEYVIEGKEVSENEIEVSITRKGNDHEQTYTVEQFRDFSRMVVLGSNARFKNQVAGVMEAIAQVAENYENISELDNASIFSTRNDKFIVIESGSNIYATLLASNRQTAWTINEDAVKALSFIKSKTNTDLASIYEDSVNSAINIAEENHKEEIEKQLEENQITSLKERIEILTEKFKDDPTKLMILSKVAAKASTL